MWKKVSAALWICFCGLFVVSISWGMLARIVCGRETADYTTRQPEYIGPDTIDIVIEHQQTGRIYVSYNDANWVNVYAADGTFLWAVATPYLRNSYCEIQEGKLIVADGEAYVYDAVTGAFLELRDEESLELTYENWDTEYTDTSMPNELYYDNHQVYRGTAEGNFQVLISCPWWHRLFDFMFAWSMAAVAALGIGVFVVINQVRERVALGYSVPIRMPWLRRRICYYRLFTGIHLLYTVLNIVFAFFGGILAIGIMPLGIHLIVSQIILSNLKRPSASAKEEALLGFWLFCLISSFVVAFLSVVVVVLIAG